MLNSKEENISKHLPRTFYLLISREAILLYIVFLGVIETLTAEHLNKTNKIPIADV